MKNQRRFAPTKTGRLAPEQVAAFLRNQWPESAEYARRSQHPNESAAKSILMSRLPKFLLLEKSKSTTLKGLGYATQYQ
jgi:hypothetical protein